MVEGTRRGGRREGAGRPPTGAAFRSLTVRLSAEDDAYLAQLCNGNKSAAVRELIRRHRERRG